MAYTEAGKRITTPDRISRRCWMSFRRMPLPVLGWLVLRQPHPGYLYPIVRFDTVPGKSNVVSSRYLYKAVN